MEIEYELTMVDGIAFNLYHAQNSPLMRRTRIFWIVAGPMIFLAIALLSTPKLPAKSVNLIFSFIAICSILWIFLQLKYFWHMYKRIIVKLLSEGKNKNISSSDPIKLTIDSDGITTFSKNAESKAKWTMIEKIANTNEHVFMCIGPANAITVPKRAFPDEAKCKEFIETAKKYHSDAAREK